MCQWVVGIRFDRSEKRQTSIVASLSVEALRVRKPRKDKRMDEIIKRLSDWSSRLSSRLSSVGRIRLVVGLIVVLFLTWLVSPVFHGLTMALYVNWPFFLVVVVGTVLSVYLWRVGDKDPAKIVAV